MGLGLCAALVVAAYLWGSPPPAVQTPAGLARAQALGAPEATTQAMHRTAEGTPLASLAVGARAIRPTLLDLIRQDPLDAQAVAAALAGSDAPLHPQARSILVRELRTGRRNRVLVAISAVRDPAFVADLLSLLAEADLPDAARRTTLKALARMPALGAEELVAALEGHLTGHVAADGDVLAALATRGGAAAVRALTSYVLRADGPDAIDGNVLRSALCAQDAEAQAALAVALRAAARDPQAAGGRLDTLLGMASVPGAVGLTGCLITFHGTCQSPALAARALAALGTIGGTEAVSYLLAIAAREDSPGPHPATQALGAVTWGDGDTGMLLERALGNPRTSAAPSARRLALLRALGGIQAASAVPRIVLELEDDDAALRHEAIRALGRIGPGARSAADALARRYEAEDERLRPAIRIALHAMGADDASAGLGPTEAQRVTAPHRDGAP